MNTNVADYLRWWNKQETFALATTIGVQGSAPLPLGTSMGVGPAEQRQGEKACDLLHSVSGSISGGCVEAAIYDVAEELLASGTHSTTQVFGYSDATAFAAGLPCGGNLEVFVELINEDLFPEFGRLAEAVTAQEAVSVATVIGGDAGKLGRHLLIFPDHWEGSLGSDRLNAAVHSEGLKYLATGESGNMDCGSEGQQPGTLRIFIRSFQRRPRMLIFGAVDFAAALADVGRLIGYSVTVCDARPVFATSRRFPSADDVVCAWPQRYLQSQLDSGAVDARTVICCLSHDEKFDIPLLQLAVRLPVAYIGAMASRRSHEERVARLRELGLSDSEISRVKSPIGLHLGGRSPHETAVSIGSEIIASKYGGTGRPLSEMTGSIHGRGIPAR